LTIKAPISEEEVVIKSRRILHAGIAVALTLAFMVWANSSTSAHVAKKGLTTLRLGYLENNPQWTPTLDPAEVTDTTSSWLTQLMNEGLVGLRTVNGKVKVYPQLATALPTVSSNGKTYTFTLRKNARFSNGDSVTAADVVWSIRRALSKKAASPVAVYDALILGYAKYNAGKSSFLGVSAKGNQVIVKIEKKAAYFLNAFTYPINNVLDPKVVNGKPLDAGGSYITQTCKANVGAGQFKPVCTSQAVKDVTSFYHSGSTPTLTLVPNPYYHGRISSVKLVIPAIDSNQTGYNSFLSGHLDLTFGVPAANQAQWRGKKGAYQYPISGIEYLAPNLDEKPFNNIHCRLALAYAIDRNALTQQVLKGAYKPLYTVVPPGFLGYYNGAGTPRYDLAKAKSELAQCPGGIDVTYVYRNDTADRLAAAPALQAMWKQAGINIQLKGETRADWLKVILQPLKNTHTALAYDDWFMDYPDPQDYIDILLHPGNAQNTADWNNAQFNALVAKANAELNPGKRAQLYIQAQKIVLSQAGFIPVDNFTEFDLVNTKLAGISPSLANGVLWARNNDWSLVHRK
jgi:ABC-type transport system substrate-binding protein